eukprot:Nitzschia sp. Nitz4//scaffold100_size80364//40970//41762//NITZ4_005346-RA/size80364-processed-gene-0.55-mRNA-1//-1//CDS//3329532100//3376//frame0
MTETSSKAKEAPQESGNFLTRSRPFKALVAKAYSVVDGDNTGEVSKSELYAGLLLVHLNLAKYAGPAACYPPTRKVCDELFDAADKDKSGGIDREEFVKIMGATCAQILSRMLVYYLVLILLVPYLAARVVDALKVENESYEEMAAEQLIGLFLFFFVIPVIWNNIDAYSEKQLGKDSNGVGNSKLE